MTNLCQLNNHITRTQSQRQSYKLQAPRRSRRSMLVDIHTYIFKMQSTPSPGPQIKTRVRLVGGKGSNWKPHKQFRLLPQTLQRWQQISILKEICARGCENNIALRWGWGWGWDWVVGWYGSTVVRWWGLGGCFLKVSPLLFKLGIRFGLIFSNLFN